LDSYIDIEKQEYVRKDYFLNSDCTGITGFRVFLAIF
jgi:hypothetical protein